MDRLAVANIRVPGVEVRVVARCASTNAVLLADLKERTQCAEERTQCAEERTQCAEERTQCAEERMQCAAALPVLLAAEEQTAGRGQRGRVWHSAPGAGATFSLLRRMRCAPRALGGLSLAVGVAAARALRGLGARDVALKWPNDLLAGGKHAGAKLGGILIQTRVQGDQIYAAVGIGINCRPVDALGKRLRRRLVALDDLLQAPAERNAVIAAVARDVLAALQAYERLGLAAFAEDWRALHAHEGRRLRVRLADGRMLSGVAVGLAPGGALRLRTRAGMREVSDGRVTANAPRVRAARRAASA